MNSKQKYKVLGLMSGTSLDGVDVACCTFQQKNSGWQFKIEKAVTIPYTASWISKLSSAHALTAEKLLALHVDYGTYLGERCKKFMQFYAIRQVDFIASHGHTIFHQPEKKFTFQLGDLHALHVASGKPVAGDFRSLDVALGGQGAPLVPLGDQVLFKDYDVCLNLGGIANISQQVKGKRTASDVCFVNMGLNYLAAKAGKSLDKDGKMASDGQLNAKMLNDLSKVYSKISSDKPSLAREFFEQKIQPILDREEISLHDRLHTFTESVAISLASSFQYSKNRITVLCTGGGAFNAYLIYRMIEHCGNRADLIIPEPDVVKFKEALVFAFLGIMRVRNEVNCLKSVTRASRDSSSGVLIGF
ncbi:MAG: anhydro-N-acetylmuramic acid kinase [Cyclobacteriaceae bacterium]|nr:anhydro-N-acetylmuramic acid kinase [Cyclobacteriaceae bacterium]